MTPETLQSLAPVLIAIAGLVAFLRYRAQNRVDDAESTQTLAVTARDIYKDGMDALKERVDQMAGEMAELRDRARSAEAAAAEAAAEAARFRVAQAEVQAELARVIAEHGIERHALKNEITARDIQIANLKTGMDDMKREHATEVRSLRDELATLRAQMGVSERRALARRDEDAARSATQDVRQGRQDDRQTAQDERETRQDRNT